MSPFQISTNYSFRGSCEHVIFSVCDGSPDLRITVDFLSDTLQNGRIGASHMGRMYVSREDGTVSIDSNTEVISMSGSTMIYQGNVAITRDTAANKTTIEFQDLGVTIVHQLGQDPSFQVKLTAAITYFFFLTEMSCHVCCKHVQLLNQSFSKGCRKHLYLVSSPDPTLSQGEMIW